MYECLGKFDAPGDAQLKKKKSEQSLLMKQWINKKAKYIPQMRSV